MPWDRVPIFGRNPVFCFEARRMWRWRVVLLLGLLAAVLVVGAFGVRYAIASDYGLMWDWLGPWWGAWDALEWGMNQPSLERTYPDVAERRGVLGFLRGPVVATYLCVVGIAFFIRAVSRYLLPALAAASTAGDRMAGRLEPLVASRMSLREILLGKAGALAAPFAVLPIVAAPPVVAIALFSPSSGLAALCGLVELCLGLLLGPLVGIRLGLCPRREPAVATAASVAMAGIGVPVALGGVGLALAWVVLRGLRFLGVAVAPHVLFLSAANVLVHGLAVAFFWTSARHALLRITEWDSSGEM